MRVPFCAVQPFNFQALTRPVFAARIPFSVIAKASVSLLYVLDSALPRIVITPGLYKGETKCVPLSHLSALSLTFCWA
jgi:hypothetical protein